MPVMMRVPDVVGVRLTGRLRPGVLATDLALTVTERLRRIDLADRFVEFFGPGVATLSAGDRAVVANMAPEYGGNSGYFPIDAQTLRYLRGTGRTEAQVRLVEDYARRQGLWFDPAATPRYSETVEFDLGGVEVSLAGPRRPQDRISAGATVAALAPMLPARPAAPAAGEPGDGAVAIAAITSCTNTSDPRLLVAAGLLARKARRLGLTPPAWVKTSLAPGSPTAERTLRRAGLLEDLEAVGFGIVGYGCTTCIGNSGPLTPAIERAMAPHPPGRRAVRQPQLPGPGPSAARGRLPGLAAAGRRLRPGRRREPGHPRRSDRPVGRRRPRSGSPICGRRGPRSTRRSPPPSTPPTTPRPMTGPRRARTGRGSTPRTAPLFPWDEASTYLRRPPFAGFGAGTRLGAYRRASADRARRRHHHRPHLAGRRRSRRTARRRSIWSRAARTGATSTSSPRAAATGR